MSLNATILVDNNGIDGAAGEWGLSIYIEYNGKVILLDTGKSDLFATNAEVLNKDLSAVDYTVLSHAHYDHSTGYDRFFEINDKAPLYVQNSCSDNCYRKITFLYKYIGIPKGLLTRHSDRIIKVKDDYRITDGVYLIPHKTPNLNEVGKREKMYTRNGIIRKYDDFSHEQSLVFEVQNGLVIFNSCSHAGADNIISEVAKTFPSRQIIALIGGFHLFGKSSAFVHDFAKRVRDTGIESIYTGHCTGEHALEILKEDLPGVVSEFRVGLNIEFE